MNGYSLNVKISEEYFFDQNSFELMEDHMDELIEAVDSLRF